MRHKARTAAAPERPEPQAPDINRAGLLQAAAAEFALHGLRGARMEVIAQQAAITRAMIYYYFGGREGLYLAVLEEAYRAIREAEQALQLDGLEPCAALRRLIAFRIDYYVEHPTLVALVAIENQHEAAFLKQSRLGRDRGSATLACTAAVLQQGQAAGVFRPEVQVLDLHQLMVSLGVFNVANRHTFGLVFGKDLGSPAQVAHTRRLAEAVVLRYVLVDPQAAGSA